MHRTPIPLRAILVTLILILVASLIRNTPPRLWAAFCFAGAPILLAARVPDRGVLVGTVLLGGTLGVWYHVLNAGENPPWLIALVYGLGAASIVCALGHAISANGDERAQRLRTVAAVSLFPAKLYFGLFILSTVAIATPLTYDLVLSTVDNVIARDASFAVGQLFVGRPTALAVVMLVYDALPFAVMLASAWRWWKRGENDPVSIPLSAGLAAVAGTILYLIVPAAGPGFLWGTRYPTQPPAEYELGFRLSAVDIRDFRNAMPSLHFTGALIVALGTWSFGTVSRSLGVAMVVVTVLATLGTGQHYVIDLVIAVPFTLAIEAYVRRFARWQRISLINGTIGNYRFHLARDPSVGAVPARRPNNCMARRRGDVGHSGVLVAPERSSKRDSPQPD